MSELLMDYVYCVIPLFVAMDPFGVLPIYISLTDKIAPAKRKTVVFHAAITAFAVTAAFIFVGKFILQVLTMTTGDFLIAGSVALFVFSMSVLLDMGRRRRAISEDETVGAVPLGTPIVAGPGTFAASLILVETYGYLPVIAGLITVIISVVITFLMADKIVKLIRPVGAKVISKIAALILAAYAVMMFRKGLEDIIPKIMSALPDAAK